MYPLRMFTKVESPKKLALEQCEGEEVGIEGKDGARSASAEPRLAFVTTRRDTESSDLSPPKGIHGFVGGTFNEHNLSPPKMIQEGRSQTALCNAGVSEGAKSEPIGANTPERPAKRHLKLTWRSRQPSDRQKNLKHRRSPSLTRGRSDNSRLGTAQDAASNKSLRLSASFSDISDKDAGLDNCRLVQASQKEGLDTLPSTPPRGSRKKLADADLNNSPTSLCPVTSNATPRSASRSLRYGSSSSISNGGGLISTLTTGVIGNDPRALFRNQHTSQLYTNSQFHLEEDPSFWQDHNVQVLIRLRPINGSEVAQQGLARCVKQDSAHTVTWVGQPETRFTFDHVAGESITQAELFRVAGVPMVENCLAGYNSCMFAYGQTGSGKTHTMLGDISDFGHQPSDNRGMTPRVFESLFTKMKLAEEAQKHENLKFKCRCSFLEIYNEQITDLLEPSSSNLQVREDATKGVYVEGLTEVEVQNEQDVLHLLLLGAANRRVAATNMNNESSRSHSVFTCIIESQWECDQMINYRFGRLNLVDLAGSERQRASGAEGERLKEAASINKSLSTLGLVIMVLVDTANGKQRHVPYRDSKLTFLLQDSLGGNSKTTIIANISPSICASLETLSTLKFAQRAKFIRNNAVVNEDAAGDVKVLRQHIQQLKDELARLRRQSISRIPTARASGVLREEVINECTPLNSKEKLNSSIEGSFLNFGNTLQSPTVLNKKIKSLEAVLAGALRRERAAEYSLKRSATEIEHLTRLVKQREEETKCCKMVLRFREVKIQRLEVFNDSSLSTDAKLAEEQIADHKELQLMRDEKVSNSEVIRISIENMRLQELLRKFEDFHNNGEREVMAQEIADLRDQLVGFLDCKLSLDPLVDSQKDALASAERRQLELLLTEVDSYRRELEECRTQLSACLTSNDNMERQLGELREELERANVACGKYKKELQDVQENALEVDCFELKQAQHEQYVIELKSQLKKSEEKAAEEARKRSQLDNQLKEALLESTNLQTELQWTKDSLEKSEGHEVIMQQSQKSPQSSEFQDPGGRRRSIQHRDAILQLQMELDRSDGDLKSHRWEEETRNTDEMDDSEVKNSVTIMQLLLDLESLENKLEEKRRCLEEAETSSVRLQKQVEETVSQLHSEKEVSESLRNRQTQVELELDALRLDHKLVLEKMGKAGENETKLNQKISQLEWKLSKERELLSIQTEATEMSIHDSSNDARKFTLDTKVQGTTVEVERIVSMKSESSAGDSIAILSRLLKKKEAEICTLQQDWEDVAAKLIDQFVPDLPSFDAARLKPTQDLIARISEHLHLQLRTAEQRLQRVTEKLSEVVKAQDGLAIVKENWNFKISASKVNISVAEQRCSQLKEELSTMKNELQRLEARTLAAEAREDELQKEKVKLGEELKRIADDFRYQVESKDQENIRLKEQMVDQYEDWVLERSDLLAASRDAESRCTENNQTISNLQRTMAKLQGQVSGAGYKPRLRESKLHKRPEDDVASPLEDRMEELCNAVNQLTAENLELRNEKLLLSSNTHKKIHLVAQKEEDYSSVHKRLLDAEEQQKQAESKVAALTLLIEEFNCSEESWLSEKASLKSEVARLESCLVDLKLEYQSCQKERDNYLKELSEMDENKGIHANRTSKEGKNTQAELKRALAALDSSEEKVKLLTDMVSTMGEDWSAERQHLIAEKEDLRMEIDRLEQQSDVRRSSDQPFRRLSENRSVPAPEASSFNINADKLRQDLDKMRTENLKLRSRAREQDQAYLCVRMELSAMHAKRKDLETEIDKLVTENQYFIQKEKDYLAQLEATALEASRKHAQLQNCELELQRLTMLLLESEEKMNAAEQAWRDEKTQLESEREGARIEANEKRNETAAMLVKFEEWKTTLREADAMVNALVRVNEKAKERWKREKERLASAQLEETNKIVQEMLEAVACTKEQVDLTKGHAENELSSLVSEIQVFRLDIAHEILKLKREIPGNDYDNAESVGLLPSVKCLDSERRSWEQQIKAASVVLNQKELTIRTLQGEVEKARQQVARVQTQHAVTQALLQEKENMILKLINEVNHLNKSMNRDHMLRQSLTRDVDNISSLRRSFSYKATEEKDNTLSVLKEEQEQLKTMVFNLEVEKSELQEQLQEAQIKTKALESTIEHLQKSDDHWIAEVQSLEEQLEESARHVSELENHRMELREEMQRQAVAFAELHEQLQKQECALEGEARALSNKAAAEWEVLHTLQEEKAELKSMVERLDAELTVYEEKASRAERSQAEIERLQREMEGLQKELLRIESLQNEIEVQNGKLDTISFQRSKLEADLASKNEELSRISEELKTTRASADMVAHESLELKCQVQELLEKVSALEEEITRKRIAIKNLEAELSTVQETMARCLEDASVDMRELEIERDNLQMELSALTEQLQATQALSDEQAALAVEASQNAELTRARAEEKQAEAEILGRSIVELESTVYALESQLGLVKRECERQRLMREDMEMELQRLQNHLSIMQAALEEAGTRSDDDIIVAQLAREEAERKLQEKDAEMQLVQKKFEILQKDSEAKAEKIRNSKAQIAELLSEAERKAAEYEDKLKAVETKLEERVNSQPTLSKGPKLKGTGSTFACIGMGHQVNSELNAERQMYERRIEELEIELSDQQREASILNGKLGAAERMTREVLQDLLGVKSDMTNVANLLGHQQEEQYSMQAQKDSLEKDEGVERLLQQLNDVIEERESWLEEISRRQSDLLAAQATIEKLQERERALRTENENIKDELRVQQKKAGNLEEEVKKLSGQQNLQQRIKHHAKIKEENNLLRIQNDELTGKLRRAELLHTRNADELAKYRTAEGKTPLLHFDEEQRLRSQVQELEEGKADLSQKLVDICERIMEAAGISKSNRDAELPMALEALLQLKIRLASTVKDLEDSKLKVKILEEKQRLNELRLVHSPMKGVFGVECLTPR
ncbi:kinesin-like protein KIN-12F isoform X4 [Physcomitrium patens]|uniref:Kinesin motor domain-containing protein n=1 Tax=Physcomitrium patens TaxID=3218 RepID=A0A7I4FJA2_PHYPA|nr:kinesin-like protein KIN-12F isoform X3 [Physcomitrium patens]|eukprot:XP_024367331.1 kinesin-like protein KIN-12F isoform X3 [Physcomitrella patens]